jgi:hypothetical protein
MRETNTAWLGNPMMARFILCKYSEKENGEVILTKLTDETFATEDKAKERAVEFYQKDKNIRFVLLKELEFPISNW